MTNSPREDGFVVIGELVLKFDKEEPPEEYRDVALRELGETPDVREATMRDLREMIAGEKDFYLPLDREDILLQFLRPCRFDTGKAFALMRRFYTFRKDNPKLYGKLLPSTENKPFEEELLTVLPNRDQHGRRIIIIESGAKWNPKACSIYELLRGVLLLIEAAMYEPITQIAGGLVILDVKNLSVNHVWQVTPGLAKTIVHCIQECLPLRVEGIHIVNQAYFFNMAYAIFKPFLGEKLKRRLHFHGQNRESLLQHIDSQCLPIKYGGDLDIEIPGKKIHDLFCHHEKEFEEALTFGYRNEVES